MIFKVYSITDIKIGFYWAVSVVWPKNVGKNMAN